jgi:hypothetical protein
MEFWHDKAGGKMPFPLQLTVKLLKAFVLIDLRLAGFHKFLETAISHIQNKAQIALIRIYFLSRIVYPNC